MVFVAGESVMSTVGARGERKRLQDLGRALAPAV
jgi:hypothetical protein